jgi:hypothetical protein
MRKHAKDAPICHTRSFSKFSIPKIPFKTFPSSLFLDFEAPKKIPSSQTSSQPIKNVSYPFQDPKNVKTMRTYFGDVGSDSSVTIVNTLNTLLKHKNLERGECLHSPMEQYCNFSLCFSEFSFKFLG